jgi:hypothetical protein
MSSGKSETRAEMATVAETPFKLTATKKGEERQEREYLHLRGLRRAEAEFVADGWTVKATAPEQRGQKIVMVNITR